MPIITGVFFVASSSFAQIIQQLPTPMQQGGMVHAMVTFTDQATGTFSVNLDPGIPEMRSLQNWSGFAANTFDPSDPWYSALDPSQENRLFSSRYGFMVDTSSSDLLPTGTSIGIRMTNRSTPGLNAYFYNSGTPTFDPVFLSSASHDYVLWNGNMWHTVFTAPNTASGSITADFEIFLADAVGAGAVDYNTTASAVSGYDTVSTTFTFNAVPEPSSVILLLLGIGFLAQTRRHIRRA